MVFNAYLLFLLLLSPFNVFFSLYGVWRVMRCFHLARSSASSSLAPTCLMSSSTVFLQLFFGRPGGLLPSTVSSMILPRGSCSSLLLTCPYHLSLLLLITTSSGSTPHLPATSSLLTWSSSVPEHLLSQLVSTPLSHGPTFRAIDHYRSNARIVYSHTTGTLLFTKRLEISLHLRHAAQTLILTALSTPPSRSSKSPR